MTYDPPNYQSDSAAAIPIVIAGGSLTVAAATPIGTAELATGQATMTTAAGLIAAARTGPAGTGRAAITIINPLTVSCYVGGSGVTTETGFPIEPGGGGVTIQTQAAVYGVLAPGSASGAVFFVESF